MANPIRKPTAPTQEETPPERRARQLGMLRELADLNMLAARDAGARIQAAGPETAEAASPTLALARATRAVTQIINLENRVAAGELSAPRRDPADPRRDALRKILLPLARDPDPARRADLRRRTDNAIDDALDLEPDDDLPLAEIALAVARTVGLPLDLATLPDDVLGIEPSRTAHPPSPHGEPAPETLARAPP